MRDVLPTLHEASVDLAYLDPPFGTGRDFGAYDDRSGALSSMTKPRDALDPRIDVVLSLCPDVAGRTWLAGLAECLSAVRRVLKPSGSAWVHLDERRAHLARLVCEIVLAPARWRSTVIWSYRRWPNKARRFQATHDVLFHLAPDDGTFNVIRDELAPSTVRAWGTNKTRSFRREDGKYAVESTDVPSEGPAMGDVWSISYLAPVALERERGSKYPTQKPESLVQRIILSSSNPGDVVLDPCAGSGTTLATSARLGRRWIGVDAGDDAIRAIEKRLGVEAES